MEKISNLFTNHPVLPESVMWIVFGIAVIVLLLWDLLFFNRKNEVPNFMHTLILCIVYILAACVFGIFVMYEEGVDKGLLFFTGFLVEKSLSLDNVFIIALILHRCKFPGCTNTAYCFGAFSALCLCAVC